MNPDITVLMPTIRLNLLEGVYNSIQESFHGSWELVCVSPDPIPESLKDKKNVTWIEDHGSPIRCRQIGLLASKGEYLCYAADDVLFYPNALDLAFGKLKTMDYKTVIVGKYLEGSQDNPFMASDEYYILKTHDFLKPVVARIPNGDKYILLNTGLISTKLVKEIGGFDCQFEACAMACVDLSIRLQNYGCRFIMQNEPLFHSTWLPGILGDHTPIHNGQVDHDMPLFLEVYATPEMATRTIVPIDTYKNCPDWWVRRFGQKV